MAEKNKFGQYFTINPIADFMVSLISHPKDSKVLEPSCGKGVFLDNLTKYGFDNITAYEIDSSLTTNFDFVEYKSFLSVPTKEKYDVVIGNPPYIRWKNIEPELKKELESNFLWNKYFNSLCDYLFIFILKSIEHLKEGGELIFICTEYWLNTTHSSTLRNYMCENGYFEDIYHFKETPLFEKVTASFIIFKYIKGVKKNEYINLYKFNKSRVLPTEEELREGTCFTKEIIPAFQVNKRWILATKERQRKLAAFEKACKKSHNNLFCDELNRIGDICDIGNGMVSGLDAAFQIKNLDYLNEAERDKIIKVMKAKDLDVYTNISDTFYIFIQEEITAEEFKSKYPHFYEHFQPYREKLACRYSYNRNIPYWEFVFPRNQKLFERKEQKIFIPCKERISRKKYFRFCFAQEEYYSTQDVTAIYKKRSTRESLEYILAYLNSRIVFEWLGLNGIAKGDIVEFSEAPIASIPFKSINWESEKEVELHDSITDNVKSYLLCKDEKYLKEIDNSFKAIFQ